MKKIIFLFVIVSFKFTLAQETIGLVFNDDNIPKSNGYTLFNTLSDDRVYLINNCGEAVNQWDFSGQISRQAYLLENGNLLQGNSTKADIRDWNNNVLWSLNYMEVLGFTMHHDIEPLPNGNFLVLIRDNYTIAEMIAEGKDTPFVVDSLDLERIVEIKPLGIDSATIVWEWKLFDHLIQDFDATKPNFGNISSSPQLLDINYDNGNSFNPIHANAIDYNEDLDQIAFSSRHLSEVFVLDHSTTAAEAATHSGGIYGKGGDFLWRWGNPEAYDQGTSDDRKLGRQHDIKWITEGSHKGKMSVFNNDGYGSDLDASSVHIIDPNDSNGVYSLASGKFLPTDYYWSYDGTILGELMIESSRSGVQIMSNGNALINETGLGRIAEIDASGNVVWVYIIPINENSTFSQFDTPIGNGSFRAHRYPENYAGFNGVAFNNTGIIEDVNSISDNCIQTLTVDNSYFNNLYVYPNPTKDVLNFNKRIDEIQVYDLTGKVVLNRMNSEFINLENLTDGLYFIKISVEENSEFIKILKN
ncbi:aryl-sulfate sulfotransferase [Aureibaculum sp. A20]|uniref:Aryl-sulfate sulfotransferase n=1 Tax=Aureibaculum flavum TaxID=2795986 RepID=A0ABS0WMM2_9FLAO|nr:aryl-sulfate sulfotransferase [Aureibaculum flavum]MBJ2173202.1 aryl-sulfate sulfotransferase [Aureibaculum flavum]